MKPQYTQPLAPQPGKLKIVEMMETVQGEGAFIGIPSVFVRTGVCNLACAGCDTKWDSWTETPIEAVAASINAFKSKHVVLTGGEPTLWQAGLAELIRLLPGKVITIESNGAVPITDDYLLQNVDLWSFSPKVGSLGFGEYFRHEVVIDNLHKTYMHNQLKYVLDPHQPEHVNSVFAFQASIDPPPMTSGAWVVPDIRIYFQPYDKTCEVNVLKPVMPMANEREYLEDLAALTKLVMERSGCRFRVLPQMHKLLIFR